MPSTHDESNDMIAQTRKALEAWDKVPPAERFAWWVRFGLIDEQGRLRRDNVEEVPIGKLNEGRPVWQAKGNGQGG